MIDLEKRLSAAGLAAKNFGEEVASMIWSREEHKDLFWAGFIAGAVVGGVLGILLASDAGRETRQRISHLASGVKDRINGKPRLGPEEEGARADVESPI